ncbi:MAG TPA: hypothetical protein VIL37_20615 [Natronosporangium sp.]
MFAIDCPRHRTRVMVPERRIRGLANTAAGILLEVECWCGARVLIQTGRRARPALATA